MTEARKKMGSGLLVYLASGSPQRRAILEELGIPFRLLAVDAQEVVAATPRETVEENARRKVLAALHASERLEGQAVVLGADTVLEAQGRLLGKPADERMAVQYLQTLSGSRVMAYSAVAVARLDAASGWLAVETAEVHFKVLSPKIIDWYLSTGEPMGRAGAFGIGRLGEVLTESVAGGCSCVSGLPKTALLTALAAVAGESWPQWLCRVPAELPGTKVQLRPLTIPRS